MKNFNLLKDKGKKKQGKVVMSLSEFHAATESSSSGGGGASLGGGGGGGIGVVPASVGQTVRINWADEMEKLDDSGKSTNGIFKILINIIYSPFLWSSADRFRVRPIETSDGGQVESGARFRPRVGAETAALHGFHIERELRSRRDKDPRLLPRLEYPQCATAARRARSIQGPGIHRLCRSRIAHHCSPAQ
jgi:hypothetical protein